MENKNKTVWWVVGIIIVIGLVWFGVSKQSASGKTIKIGFVGPLTGDISSIGTVSRAGMEVAVDEINATGGINGKQIEAIYEDGGCNAQSAVGAAQKLINVDKVIAIIGGECSTESSAFGAMAMQNKVIMMSPLSSAPSLSNTGKYFFRDYPSDAFQGKFGAEYAYNTLGARKVAVLYHVSDYGTGLKDVFSQRFHELGGTIVDAEGTPQTATDYRSQLSKIKSLKPDLIYVPLYTEGAIAALTQASQLGIKTQFLGGDTYTDTTIQTKVSGKVNILYTLPVQVSLPQDFKDKVLAITKGTEITLGTPEAYDAMKLFAINIAKVGTDPDKLADAIRATQYNGLSGDIAFDQKGDLTSASYVVWKIEKGSATLLK